MYSQSEVQKIEADEFGFLRSGIDEKGQNGLDIGCGSCKVFDHAIGFDTARMERTDLSKVNPTHAEWVGDAHVLPFKDDVLDYIVSKHVLEHLEWKPALTEWVRCLKPGGVLRLIVPNPESPDHPGHGLDQSEVAEFLLLLGMRLMELTSCYDNFSWGLSSRKGT